MPSPSTRMAVDLCEALFGVSMAEEVDKKFNAYDLITEKLVSQAFKSDFGNEAVLNSFEIEDFTQKGDNYSSVVTSIKCHGTVQDQIMKSSYVVKLNPSPTVGIFGEIMTFTFMRENEFYINCLPKLNKILAPIKTSLPFFAEYLFLNEESIRDILITKDLRTRGFRMFDRTKGIAHTEAQLAIAAIAKFHASSYVLKKKKNCSLVDLLPFLKKSLHAEGEQMFKAMLSQGLDGCLKLIQNVDRYKNIVQWFKDQPIIEEHFELMQNYDPKFECICHGDFWNNNMVFKYDNGSDAPIEVVMLDLQLCIVGSIGLDLTYFMCTSLKGSDRMEHLKTYQTQYYDEYKKIIEACDLEMPFTMKELEDEYNRMLIYGIVRGICLLPAILAVNDQCFDVGSIEPDNMKTFMAKWYDDNLDNMMNQNSSFETRLLALFDDLEHYKAFKNQE